VSIAIAFFTRKIFLDKLGADFIGLTGTLQSLLGFLNLAELGVGTAIGYVLYKPIYDEDRIKINEIISVFGFLYRCIGLFIVGVGVILSLFLPLIFPDTPFSWGVIYFGFYAYLFASMLGYFVNYKQTLLSADQRNYVVTGYFQLTTTVKMLVQMVQAMTTTSFYLYLAIEIVFGIVHSLILEWKINQTYPWLKSEIRLGRSLFKKYPEIGKYVKQLFIHKIGEFVQYQLSPLLIYSYVSLPIVALYGNYTLLTERIRAFFSTFLGSTGAGIGSLISEGDPKKIYSVYKELLAFRVFLSGVVSISIYM
jgi:O-antigen/teichoic acid export membrane protein